MNSIQLKDLAKLCCLSYQVVRVEGLEPPRLTAPEPKSGASTNFATPAKEIFLSSTNSLPKGLSGFESKN